MDPHLDKLFTPRTSKVEGVFLRQVLFSSQGHRICCKILNFLGLSWDKKGHVGGRDGSGPDGHQHRAAGAALTLSDTTWKFKAKSTNKKLHCEVFVRMRDHDRNMVNKLFLRGFFFFFSMLHLKK